jgi:predicted DNA-binding antitoxin AbrB/MazE fold protein
MRQIEAIFRRGVFEPLELVYLQEGQRLRLQFEPADKEPLEEWLARVKQHHAALVEKYGCLPDSTPGIAEDRLRGV